MKTLGATMRAAFSLLVLACASLMFATPPPPPEPFATAFARFRTTWMPECEDLAREVRIRFSGTPSGHHAKRLEVANGYLGNLRMDDIPGIHRALDGKTRDRLSDWSKRTITDIVGFRRMIDEFVVEALGDGRFRYDDDFANRIRKFWEQESYFSWRFGLELDTQQTGVKKPNNVPDLTPPVTAPAGQEPRRP